MTGDGGGLRYLAVVADLLARLQQEQWPAIQEAADAVAQALRQGRDIHAFGTGHSHMLAEELYYRAGGLVRVRPILFDGLMLHPDARLSTDLERLPGLAAALLERHPIAPADVVVVASNSGRNAVVVELATLVRDRGATVIAVTSLRHATSPQTRSDALRPLHEIAHIVIDNGGVVGDATVDLPGTGSRVGPTSTVIGAAALNAVVVEAADRLARSGHAPEIYVSANAVGGDAANGRQVPS